MSMPLKYHTRRILDLDSFLSLFQKVTGGRPNGQGIRQYTAQCPAHETNHQSLAIGVTRDGRYLVHCYAGCGASEVLSAVGLTLADLYPDGGLVEASKASVEPTFRHMTHRYALEIAAADRAAGKRLSAADKQREREAFLALRVDQQWPR